MTSTPLCHRSKQIRRCPERRQFVRIQVQEAQKLLAPDPVADVEHVTARGFAEVGFAFAGEFEVDVILGSQKSPGRIVRFGRVPLDPRQLERRPGDGRRVRRNGEQGVRIMLLQELSDEFSGPFIVP